MADDNYQFYIPPDPVDASQDAAQDAYDNGQNPAAGYDSRADVVNRLQQQGVGPNSALGFYSSLLGDDSQPLTKNQVDSIFSDLGKDQYKTTVFDNLKKDDSTTTGAEIGTTAYKKVGDNNFERAESHANDLVKQMADNGGTLPPLPYAPTTDQPGIQSKDGKIMPPASDGSPAAMPPRIGTAPGDPANPTPGPLGGISDILSGVGKGMPSGAPGIGVNGLLGGLNGMFGGGNSEQRDDWGRRIAMAGMAIAAINNPGAWSAYASLAGQGNKENNLTKLGTGQDDKGQYMLFSDARGNISKKYLPAGYNDISAEKLQLQRDKMSQDNINRTNALTQRQLDMQEKRDKYEQQRQDKLDQVGTSSKFQTILDDNQPRADDSLYVANEANRLREAIRQGQFTPSMLAEAKMRFDNGINGSTPADRFLKDSVALFESAASNRVASEKGAGTQFKLEQAKRQFLPDGAKYDTGAMLDSLGRLSGIATRQYNGATQAVEQVYARPGMRDQAALPNPNSPDGNTSNADYYQDQADDLRDRNADHDVADRGFQAKRDARNYPTQGGSSFRGTGGPAKQDPPTVLGKDPQADFEKLPSGAIYIGPDGKRRTKP